MPKKKKSEKKIKLLDRKFKKDYLLFLNVWEGLGYVLDKKLSEYKIEAEWYNSKDNLKEFRKYGIKSTPVLLALDNGEVSDRLCATDEIVEYFREDVSNNKTQVGGKK